MEGTDHFLVDLRIKPGNKIFVYLDGDHGVTIEVCRELNRYIESQLNRDEEDYDLTVSSAGADAPLTLLRQFPQHIGRTFELNMNDGKSFEGKLLSVKGDAVEIDPLTTKKEPKKEILMLAFDTIKEARVKLSFKK